MSGKILIATTIWGRPEIFKIFCKNNGRFADILAVGSESDKSRDLAKSLGCFYIEFPNKPLGMKFNARLKWFLDRKEYSHIILLGSDDLICSKAFAKLNNLRHKYDVISWKDIYFYDIERKIGMYSSGYKNNRKGEPFAPGRCISRKFIEENNGILWSNKNAKQGLDLGLWNKIKKIKNHLEISAIENDCIILDIKTNKNITGFEKLKKSLATRDLYQKEIVKICKMIQ